MTLIYKSNNMEVRIGDEFENPFTFVTFSHFGDLNHAERKGFGETFFNKNKIKAIHVLCMNDQWYQYEEMDLVLGIIKKAAGNTSIITYGSSMGGYAAINFAEKLSANKVIAISPQFSINPILVPFEHRWDSALPDISFKQDNISLSNSSAEHYIIYDNKDNDKFHADMIFNNVKNCTLLYFRYSGHPSGDFLVETGLLGDIIIGVVESRIDIKSVLSIARKRRRQSSAYFRTIAEALSGAHIELKISLIKKSIILRPDSKLSNMLLAKFLIASQQWRAALDAILKCRALGDNSAYILHLQSVALSALGDRKNASQLAESAVESEPNNALYHEYLSRFLFEIARHHREVANKIQEERQVIDTK